MSLNCRQGDIAIVIRSWAGNDGKIVQCLRLANAEETKDYRLFCKGPMWVIDQNLRFVTSHRGVDVKEEFINLFPDVLLRPIKGGEGEDEMIRIAGKPTEKILEYVR